MGEPIPLPVDPTVHADLTGSVDASPLLIDGVMVSNQIAYLTDFIIEQLLNINTDPISATQWGYLSGLNQSLTMTSTPTFGALTLGMGTLASPSISLGTLLGIYSTASSIRIGAGTDNVDFGQLATTMLKQVQIQSGAVSAPGLAFVGDSKTGIFQSGPSTINFTTDGTNELSISSTGVQIAQNLTVTGSLSAGLFAPSSISTGAITATSLSLQDGSALMPSIRFAAEPNTGVFRAAAGDIGITILSAKILDITPTGIAVTGSATVTGQYLTADGKVTNPAVAFTSSPQTGFYLSAPNTLATAIGGVQALTISPSGLNVSADINVTGSITANSLILSALQVASMTVSDIMAAAGSAAAPSFTFTIDSDSGFFHPADNILGFACGGSEIMRITTTGISVTGTVNASAATLPAGSLAAPPLTIGTGAIYSAGAGTIAIGSNGMQSMLVSSANVQIAGGLLSAGSIKVPDGAVGAPSYTFTSDTTTGIYLPSAGSVAFTCMGTQILDLSAASGAAITGNLNVGGNIAFTGTLTFPNGAVGAPSITFTSDPTTGIYRVSAGVIGVTCNTTQVVQYATTGITISPPLLPTAQVRGADGTSLLPEYTFQSETGTGIYRAGPGVVGITGLASVIAQFSTSGSTISSSLTVNSLSTGSISFGSGAAATPSITFTADTKSGFYLSAVSDIGVTVTGVKIADFTSAGLTLTGALSAATVSASGAVTATEYDFVSSASKINLAGNNIQLQIASTPRITATTSGATIGGTVLAAAGLVGSPTYSFSVDSTTGMYRDPSGLLEFAVAGQSILSLSTTGSVLMTGIVIGGSVSSGSVTSTGIFSAPVGAAATPSFTFTGNTNTGIFSSASNIVSIAANGTKIADFTSSSVTISGSASATQFLGANGAVGTPTFTFTSEQNSGLYRVAAGDIGVAIGGIKVADITAVGVSSLSFLATAGTLSLPGFAFSTDTHSGINLPAAGEIDVVITGAKALIVNSTGISAATITATSIFSAPIGAVGTPTYTFTGNTNTGFYSTGANALAFACNGVKIVDVTSTGLTVTGQIIASVGGVGAPGILFTGDPNTGLYHIGTGEIGIACTGTKILDISTSGVAITGSLTLSSAYIAPIGSAAAPSFTFTGDTTSGMYDSSAGVIGFSSGGTSAATLSLTGFTAVGTITSSTKFVAPVGSSAGPTYVFAGDLGTGFYHPAANTVGITAGVDSTQVIAFSPTGSVLARGQYIGPAGTVSLPGLALGSNLSGIYSGGTGIISTTVNSFAMGTITATAIPSTARYSGGLVIGSTTKSVYSRLDVVGDASVNDSSPNIGTYFAGNQYPGVFVSSYSHDNGALCFDAVYSSTGSWLASDTSTAWQVSKSSGVLNINYATSAGAGSAITWAPTMSMYSTGLIIMTGSLTVPQISAAGVSTLLSPFMYLGGGYQLAADTLGTYIGVGTSTKLTINSAGIAVSGQATLSDGNTGSPGLAFTAETNTGLYRAGSGNIGVTVSGTTIANFTGTGLSVTNLTITGALVLPLGLVGAPSLTFTGDTNTGIYHSAVGTVSASSSGSLVWSTSTAGITMSLGQVRLANGTVGSPSLAFASETNTGLFRAAAGDIGLVVGGQSVGDITASGINTTTLTTSTKILNAAGAVGAPAYSFTVDPTTGLYRSAASALSVTAGGTLITTAAASGLTLATGQYIAPSGSTTGPAFAFTGDTSTGIYRIAAGSIGISCSNTSVVTITGLGLTLATGQYFAPVGSAASPTFSFSSDPSTGIYRSAASALSISAGGTLVTTTSNAGLTLALATGQYIAPVGAVGAPSFTFTGDLGTGMYRSAASALSITAGGTLITTAAAAGLTLATGQYFAPAGTAAAPTFAPRNTNSGIYSGAAGVLSFAANAQGMGAVTAANVAATTRYVGGLTVGSATKTTGIGRLELVGDSGVADTSPAIVIAFPSDANPVCELLPFAHDNTTISFDAYYSAAGAWTSSYATSNYQIEKRADALRLNYVTAPAAAGSTITWSAALTVDTTGAITIGVKEIFPVGAVGAPTITFAGDTNTGFYHVGAGDIGVSITGTKVADFTSTGLTLPGTLSVATLSITSQVVAPVGAVGSPSYSFLGDLTTGMYRSASGVISFSALNTLIESISSAGCTLATGQYIAPVGAVGAPSFTFTGDLGTGMYRSAASALSIAAGGTLITTTAAAGLTLATGQIIVPVGTQGAPTYTFTGDLNTGLYHSAAGQVAFTAVGVTIANIGTGGLTMRNNQQIFAASGAFAAPSYSFNNATGTGMFLNTITDIQFAVGGAAALDVVPAGIRVPNGTVAAPGLAFQGASTTGFYLFGTGFGCASAGTQMFAATTTGTIMFGPVSMTQYIAMDFTLTTGAPTPASATTGDLYALASNSKLFWGTTTSTVCLSAKRAVEAYRYTNVTGTGLGVTVGTTYATYTAMYTNSTNDDATLFTPGTTSITVNAAGIYIITATMSIALATATRSIGMAIYVNGVDQAISGARGFSSATNDVVDLVVTTRTALAAGAVVTIPSGASASTSCTIYNAYLRIQEA